MTRKIIHCDADCFFAAVEMRDNPALRDIPIAIGGSPDRRGVISTCNYPARRFGIHSAMASRTALRLCPDLLILPHNMEKYREAAALMRAIFHDYTDLVEPLSLDEAYLDVSDCDAFGGSATRIAQDIRRRVAQTVGITLSAGVARSKFIAKVASDWRKPDGLFVVPPEREAEFVARLPVAWIHGVGKVTAEKLERLGVDTCGDLLRYDEIELVNRFGVFGHRLYRFARGIDDRPVKPRRVRKSLSVEHTFARDLDNLAACRQQLPALYRRLRQRLDRRHGTVRKLFVKIRFDDLSRTTVETTGTAPRYSLFEQLLTQSWLRTLRPVRLIGLGVRFDGADPDAAMVQLDLLGDAPSAQ